MTDALPNWQLLWAKSDRDNRDRDGYDPAWTRPLWAHLLDVGHTALLLWERTVPDALRRQASGALGITEKETGVWLSFWIGLHDLGKAIPSFQFQDPGAKYLQRMQREGFSLRPPEACTPVHHGHASIAILARELDAGEDGRTTFKESLAAFVGFHHGRLSDVTTWRGYAADATVLGGSHWRQAQGQLTRELYALWDARYGLAQPSREPERVPDWLLGLAGWATLADWLGSFAAAFPGKGHPDDPYRLHNPAGYVDASREGASAALVRAGFGARGSLVARPFAELFPELAAFKPRPIQRALLDVPLPADPTAPTLTLVEAPTGEGKTEAALALAARQQDRDRRGRDSSRGGGLYLALPTQATANGLLQRATDFLTHAHDGPTASFRLAYGRSELHPEAAALVADPDTLSGLYDDTTRDGSDASPLAARVRTLRWFLGRKRALLAPYGLGTIDQSLLGVLYARHFFLRLFGLAGKTVIVDEVHAYDVYMNHLVRQLLPWLRALGAHVILLSATLPARTRRDLLAAWDAEATPPEASGESASGLAASPEATGYPAVWTSAEGRVARRAGEADGLTADRTQTCTLYREDPGPAAVAHLVAQSVASGAAVAVVCNTVQRAQDIFEAIQTKLGGTLSGDDLILFHARFVRRERQRIEQAVVGHRDSLTGEWVPGRFGKGRAPGPAVLVGTQVIEQSLDLDVDLMLSDLAPIDLLLQRAGRLHRHDRQRPRAHATPRFVWLCPDWPASGLPNVDALSGHGHVYTRTSLWRTARLLTDRASWSLPADYRPLIEAVYGADAMADGLDTEATAQWKTAVAKEDEAARVSRGNAGDRMIPLPSELYRMIAEGQHALADDDDEAAHASLKAMTREGESVEVVVLHEGEGGGLYLDPAHTLLAPLALPAPRKALLAEDVRQILGASVRLSQKRFVNHFRHTPPQHEIPSLWREAAAATPSLSGLHPVVMRDGVWDASGRALSWHDALGLVAESS